ncbi:jg24115 [Pararge aegeria aegeria]|uniref:Jg24115 protein n=1 Tax=Pararge aegeria aegeria TaxID=348720 RepID=A0A8S4QYH3_9NEOP|nr:jg24115 [Pararge aegeria aegeria]
MNYGLKPSREEEKEGTELAGLRVGCWITVLTTRYVHVPLCSELRAAFVVAPLWLHRYITTYSTRQFIDNQLVVNSQIVQNTFLGTFWIRALELMVRADTGRALLLRRMHIPSLLEGITDLCGANQEQGCKACKALIVFNPSC